MLTTINITIDRQPASSTFGGGNTALDPHISASLPLHKWHTWTSHLPPINTIALSFFQTSTPADGAVSARTILALLATLGRTGADQRPTLPMALWSATNLRSVLDKGKKLLIPDGPDHDPCAPFHTLLTHHRHDPHADGTFTLENATITGTGSVAGSWDADGFFAPILPHPVQHTHLSTLLTVGAIAFLTGALSTWIASRPLAPQPLSIRSLPWDGMEERLERMMGMLLTKHGLLGLSVQTLLREDAHAPYHGTLARDFQARTRMNSASQRAGLAADLTASLFNALTYQHVWIPNTLPQARGWRPGARYALLADMCKTAGTSQAFQQGQAFAQRVPHNAPMGDLIGAGHTCDLW